MGKVIEATMRFLRIKEPIIREDTIFLTKEMEERYKTISFDDKERKFQIEHDEYLARMLDREVQKTWDNP
jgi:hypothetical protein